MVKFIQAPSPGCSDKSLMSNYIRGIKIEFELG